MRATRSKIVAVEGGPGCLKSDRVLTGAILISLVAHLAAVGVIAHCSASRLGNVAVSRPPRYIKVELIDLPENKARPAPRFAVPRPESRPAHPRALPQPNIVVAAPPIPDLHGPAPTTSRPVISTPTSTRQRPDLPPQTPGNPGGELNVGTVGTGGDIPGRWTDGSTPVGWVPGADQGSGKGSGSGVGVGTPDPPRNADPGPGTRPAPVPPPPATVSVRVCSVSGLRPSEYCKDTRIQSFLEGHAPSRTCDRCKPPEHNSIIADRANPEIIKDARPIIPSSVPEGLSVTVVIEYTVTAQGSVSDIQVTRSSGYKLLDRAVVDSASKLKYKPAMQNGVARSVRKTRTYDINT